MQTSAIVLAAGSGKRMKSARNKVLHLLCGRPIVGHVVKACRDVGVDRIYVVVGRDAEQVQQVLGPDYTYVLQEQQLGTGHAVMQAEPHLGDEESLLVLYGDTPLISPTTLQSMIELHQRTQADATVLTAVLDEPGDYGRIVRDEQGNILRLVEARDASPDIRAIREINTGFYCFRTAPLRSALRQLTNDNAQGEYYLTDVIAAISADGGRVAGCRLEDMNEALGINDRVRLAEAEDYLRARIRRRLMLEGVTFLQPDTCLVDDTVRIGRDTIVYPGCVLEGETIIGEGCTIGPATRLVDTTVGDDSTLEYTVARQAAVGSGCQIGPFAYLRPQTCLADNVKIGDFVEVKNSQVGSGSKIPHLSYVGDADIGERVNLGAGTILVNYDGRQKTRSTIEDDAFIGCNSNIVSPVTIGQGAYVAAGSTITDDVPADSLGIARARQTNKEGWAKRRREAGKSS
ncbi:MAG: bifunctional UDP-N-acetylglucosamine diphosphorylase/glucosamine-1-phosphate N-acetyltransferase GlmU [Bacillota bacterium]